MGDASFSNLRDNTLTLAIDPPLPDMRLFKDLRVKWNGESTPAWKSTATNYNRVVDASQATLSLAAQTSQPYLWQQNNFPADPKTSTAPALDVSMTLYTSLAEHAKGGSGKTFDLSWAVPYHDVSYYQPPNRILDVYSTNFTGGSRGADGDTLIADCSISLVPTSYTCIKFGWPSDAPENSFHQADGGPNTAVDGNFVADISMQWIGRSSDEWVQLNDNGACRDLSHGIAVKGGGEANTVRLYMAPSASYWTDKFGSALTSADVNLGVSVYDDLAKATSKTKMLPIVAIKAATVKAPVAFRYVRWIMQEKLDENGTTGNTGTGPYYSNVAFYEDKAHVSNTSPSTMVSGKRALRFPAATAIKTGSGGTQTAPQKVFMGTVSSWNATGSHIISCSSNANGSVSHRGVNLTNVVVWTVDLARNVEATAVAIGGMTVRNVAQSPGSRIRLQISTNGSTWKPMYLKFNTNQHTEHSSWYTGTYSTPVVFEIVEKDPSIYRAVFAMDSTSPTYFARTLDSAALQDISFNLEAKVTIDEASSALTFTPNDYGTNAVTNNTFFTVHMKRGTQDLSADFFHTSYDTGAKISAIKTKAAQYGYVAGSGGAHSDCSYTVVSEGADLRIQQSGGAFPTGTTGSYTLQKIDVYNGKATHGSVTITPAPKATVKPTPWAILYDRTGAAHTTSNTTIPSTGLLVSWPTANASYASSGLETHGGISVPWNSEAGSDFFNIKTSSLSWSTVHIVAVMKDMGGVNPSRRQLYIRIGSNGMIGIYPNGYSSNINWHNYASGAHTGETGLKMTNGGRDILITDVYLHGNTSGNVNKAEWRVHRYNGSWASSSWQNDTNTKYAMSNFTMVRNRMEWVNHSSNQCMCEIMLNESRHPESYYLEQLKTKWQGFRG